ncbi:MAG: response regulator [Niabella sp.]
MKPTVLLVEDNRELLDVITEELNEYYNVLSAADGREALQILSGKTVHLVISDVMMPVMDGFELCEAIKSNSLYSHIPVILLTAKNMLESKVRGLGLGADAYIDKPFDMEYVLAQIDSLLANREKIKEHLAQSSLIQDQSADTDKNDEPFLETLTQAILSHIDDTELDIDKLSKFMNISRTSLFRKTKSITNLTPNEMINSTRLKKAAELLKESNYKIYEVSYMVGYTSQTHFGRNFLKQFGVTPSEYQKKDR